jgi:hypothetical protein
MAAATPPTPSAGRGERASAAGRPPAKTSGDPGPHQAFESVLAGALDDDAPAAGPKAGAARRSAGRAADRSQADADRPGAATDLESRSAGGRDGRAARVRSSSPLPRDDGQADPAGTAMARPLTLDALLAASARGLEPAGGDGAGSAATEAGEAAGTGTTPAAVGTSLSPAPGDPAGTPITQTATTGGPSGAGSPAGSALPAELLAQMTPVTGKTLDPDLAALAAGLAEGTTAPDADPANEANGTAATPAGPAGGQGRSGAVPGDAIAVTPLAVTPLTVPSGASPLAGPGAGTPSKPGTAVVTGTGTAAERSTPGDTLTSATSAGPQPGAPGGPASEGGTAVDEQLAAPTVPAPTVPAPTVPAPTASPPPDPADATPTTAPNNGVPGAAMLEDAMALQATAAAADDVPVETDTGRADIALDAATSVLSGAIPAPLPLDRAAAAAPTAPAVPAPGPELAPPADQIVRHIRPLQHLGDGDYELSMQLHPADLGPVAVSVRILNGVVHVNLQAEQASTNSLLRQAAPELKAALEQSGMQTGDLDFGRNPQPGTMLSDGQTGHGRPGASGRSPSTGGDRSEARSDTPVHNRRSSGGADDTLDVLL